MNPGERPGVFVHELFLESAQQYSHQTALITPEKEWTYARLREDIGRLTALLIDQGLQTGDRVAIDLGNDALAVQAIWATLMAGGTFVCMDPSTPDARFLDLLKDFRPGILLTRMERWKNIPAEEMPASVLVHGGEEGELPADLQLRERISRMQSTGPVTLPGNPADHLANLVYTSGSTGLPKGVMMSHAAMGAAITGITSYLRSDSSDRTLCLLPLSFDYGLYQALMTGATGGCLVLEPGFGYPGEVMKILADRQITTLPGVPTVFALLLRMKSFDSAHLPHLKTMTNTGAALPTDHIQLLRERFAAVRLYSMYGLTECKRVSYLPPEELERRPGSVGIPMPGCEVAVVDEQGHRLPSGQAGELVIRGENLMRGYWERPEATEAILRPGPWPDEVCLYSGDLFRQDEDGFLYFISRRDDVFKCRGEKVAPSEIEQVLHSMEGITEAAVVGIEHPVLGKIIRAVIIPDASSSVTIAEIREYCRLNLESFKLPGEILLVNQLPRGSRGKIDRNALIRLKPGKPSQGVQP